MTFFEAILLGIIQGLTEFLPVSSTGHLTIAGKIMGLVSTENPEHWTAFIAVIQLGTLLAIIVYFWKDLWGIFIDFIRDNILKNLFNSIFMILFIPPGFYPVPDK